MSIKETVRISFDALTEDINILVGSTGSDQTSFISIL